MKIACIDKTAAERIKLQRFIDGAYQSCRSSVGHLSNVATIPASRDEVLLNTPPNVVAVGPGFTPEEAYLTAREIRGTHANVPIIVVLADESYTLRTLKRFERVADEVVTSSEQPIRLIHKISTFGGEVRTHKAGRIVVVEGVKGGVGSTSIVSGLAHAANALGKEALVVDLSPASALIHYMAADRWQSPDYAAYLSDRIVPEWNSVQRCITEAPNGVRLLLPPAGGTDVRELWLRDRESFEITLSMLDLLRERFDVILIDLAGAEGVLNFALHARADARLLVTSNDPASVHLLNNRLNMLAQAPGDSPLNILLNMTLERGLTKEDLLDFLVVNENFEESMAALKPIQYDSRGASWIGTGNTFYTESSKSTQRILEQTLSHLLGELQQEVSVPLSRISRGGLLEAMKRLTSRKAHATLKDFDLLALPEGPTGLDAEPANELTSPEVATSPLDDELYQAPRKVAND